MKPILEWTVREWLQYHQQKVHQGSVSGFPQLQQTWMGRVIWKNPLDCWIYQEILYETKPQVIVEIGVAHGGNALYLAHLLDLLGNRHGQVVGIDIDLSRAADLRHPRIRTIQGNCVEPNTVKQVVQLCGKCRTMVIADCDHSKAHVLDELAIYAPLVSVGCYYIVEDGICDAMQWDPVPGPRAACEEFLQENQQFVNDGLVREKYLITYNFNGYLRRIQ